MIAERAFLLKPRTVPCLDSLHQAFAAQPEDRIIAHACCFLLESSTTGPARSPNSSLPRPTNAHHPNPSLSRHLHFHYSQQMSSSPTVVIALPDSAEQFRPLLGLPASADGGNDRLYAYHFTVYGRFNPTSPLLATMALRCSLPHYTCRLLPTSSLSCLL